MLMYDNKFAKLPGKLQMHWLGLYVINSINSGRTLQLQQLDGVMLPKLVNGSRMNPYRTGPDSHDT